MKILVLILLAFLLFLIGRVYIIKRYNNETNFHIKSFFSLSLKRDIFLLVFFVLLVGMAFWLNLIYATNSLMHNMKMITLISLLVIVTMTDHKENIIPNVTILFGLVARIVFYIAELITLGSDFWPIIKNDLIALGIVALFFILGVLVVKNGIGMGDIKLMLVMALFQGFSGIFSSMFFSLTVALILSVILLITKKKTRKDSIPFAPSVLIGTFISITLSGM